MNLDQLADFANDALAKYKSTSPVYVAEVDGKETTLYEASIRMLGSTNGTKIIAIDKGDKFGVVKEKRKGGK